jgi:hypothetical protein
MLNVRLIFAKKAQTLDIVETQSFAITAFRDRECLDYMVEKRLDSLDSYDP